MPEEHEAALLAAYDEALAQGLPPTLDEQALASLGPDGGGELREDLRWLERLARRRPRRRGANAPTDPGAPAAPDPPRRLGRFHLLCELGRGGHGVVFLAFDPDLHRQVALKVPRPEALLTPEMRQRFLREAHTAAGLDHPNLVPVYEAGEAGLVCYIASAYCPGPSLAAWFQEQPGPMDPRAAAQLVATAAGAVHHMHSRGVLHRDLKPANILLQGADAGVDPGRATPLPRRGAATPAPGGPPASPWPGVPRITDFGLAKQVAAADGGQTHTGAMLGTPAYMAPEQAAGRGRDVSTATDVYALGVVLYECLTGRPPFAGTGGQALLQQVLSEEPPPPRRWRPEVPRDLEAICLKCLEKSPGRRYASAAALADDLQRFLADRPTRARPVGAYAKTVRWCRRRPAVAALLAVIGLGLPALACDLYLQQRSLRSQDDAMLALAAREQAVRTAVQEERRRFSRLTTYVNDVRLAAKFSAEGDRDAAARALAAYADPNPAEDVRGFEWYWLWRLERRKLMHHPGQVTAVAWSPDGQTCASASDGEDAIRVWETTSGHLLARLGKLGAKQPHTLRFTRDGKRLVSVASGSTRSSSVVWVWDTAVRHGDDEQPGAGTEFRATAVSPDGATVAPGNDRVNAKGRVRLWRPTSRRTHDVWHLANARVYATCFTSDGRRLAIAYDTRRDQKSEGMQIDLVDLQRGRVQATLDAPRGFIGALAFSPDGATLAAGARDGIVGLWDVATRRETKTLPVGDPVRAVTFSPDGRTLAAGAGTYLGTDKVARAVTLWDVASGTRLPRELRCDGVFALAYSPDGRTLAVGAGDGLVRLWKPHLELRSLPGHQPKEAWAVAFFPDGRTLVSSGDDHALRFWDVATGRQLRLLMGHRALVSCVAITPDGMRIASGSYDRTVKVWDVGTGKVTFTGRHRDDVRRVAFSPDGKLLASSGRDQTVRVWELATGAERATLTGHGEGNVVLAFAGPRLLASACGDRTMRLWDLDTRQTLWVIRDTPNIICLTASADGAILATGNKEGSVKLWETATGRELLTLQAHTQGEVRAVALSVDGRTLASAAEDKTVRLWQVATGLELLTFKDQPHFINGLAFSLDGRHLAAALHDGSVRIWPAADGHE
jgi:WD40 repeat protein